MSKRVYEIAKELGLNNKEVISRFNAAGVEVSHHSASIADPDFEKVFGGGNGQAVTPEAKNGRSEAQEAEVKEAQAEAAESGDKVAVADAPADKPVSEPAATQGGSGGSSGGGSRKRRRVVIDASATNRGPRATAAATQEAAPKPTEEEHVEKVVARVEPGATVKDLADALEIPPAQIIKVLMGLGEMRTVTQTLSNEEIELIAEELEQEVEVRAIEEPVIEEVIPEDDPADLVEKPPVVTVMGHVDHGKTSLLDRIRKASVQTGEAGGITQHIGAYQARVGDKSITFIDTPGHAAFTKMRARGAKVTDVVILVVAADDGIMPQTQEAIEHSRAAGVPLVVALNKIDVPNANPDRVLGQLSEQGLMPESYGGETVTVPVSAKTGEGFDELLENILVVAELEELKSNPKAPASGYVIEGERDPGRGPVATLLLSRGTLNKGDVVLAGTAYGRVRAMLDSTGTRVKDAVPGDAVEILGLSGIPEAGTRFEVVERERVARDRAQQAESALQRVELAQ
ncbi:MAG: translation initiation factor IF-2, partial [Rubrobacteraceae bacterium]